MPTEKSKICPVEIAGGLDNRFRRWLQNPDKILKPYIRPGMNVLDLGCGPGFFTLAIARLLNNSGEVIAADLQPGMLNIISKKINGTALKDHVRLHQCEEDSIGLSDKVDFELAFWMVHEVPDQNKLFQELHSILKAEGNLLIIEPKFHVTKRDFDTMVEKLTNAGFVIQNQPHIFFSRSVLLKKAT